jgi:eukaryotic-like serine/threonine-protein kinase
VSLPRLGVTTRAMPTETERRIADRYVLEEPLGRGGMGVVWRARDTLLERHVAIKQVEVPVSMPGPEISAVRRRVLREARAAAALNHANAVTVFDVLEDDDRAYIVMELVGAPTMKEIVDAGGPMPPQEAARVGLGILEALSAAHARGITHRDVKPANVMLPEDGAVKLADFGIASVKDDPKITATGMVLGSPQFMAPEQARHGEAGPPADLWGLGATLYFAVEGKPPFEKEGGPIPILTAVLREEPRPAQHAGALSPVIEALLSKEPGDRPDEGRVRSMLTDISSGEGGAAPAPTGAALGRFGTHTSPAERMDEHAPSDRVVAPPPAPRAAPRGPAPPRGKGLGGWMVAAGVLALAALVAVLTLSGLFGRDDDPSEEARRRGDSAQADSGEGGGNGEGEGDPGEPGQGLETYTDPDTGWSIEYPSGWDVVAQSVDSDSVDLTDPSGGRYLRVDWTDQPGPDAMAALEDQAPSFGARHAGYQEIQLVPTTFAESDNAGLWEYGYEEGGARLHAYNLQFVTSDESYGFALNFQTTEEQWAASQGLWETLTGSFELP